MSNLIPQLRRSVRTNVTFQMAVTQVAAQFPAFELPSGAVLYVRALPNNPVPVTIATNAGDAENGAGQLLGPNTQVAFPCTNTRELFAACPLPLGSVGGVSTGAGSAIVNAPNLGNLVKPGQVITISGAGPAGVPLETTVQSITDANDITVLPVCNMGQLANALITGLVVTVGLQISILG